MQTILDNKYRIIRKITSGGMADILLAKSQGSFGFEKVVAIKKIKPDWLDNEDLVAMFINEARLVAGLTHSNIVQILDFGIDRSATRMTPYIVMEYINGTDLRYIANHAEANHNWMSAEHVAFLGIAICSGLAYAHERRDATHRPLKLVHRDISPHNILISTSGEVKITDFGVAKATALIQNKDSDELVAGKIAYMSPEQIQGFPLDPRSDLFALGVVLFELLTRQRCFKRNSTTDTIAAVQDALIPPFPPELDIPVALQNIILKALKINPDHRYDNARDMGRDLLRFMGSSGSMITNEDLARYLHGLFPALFARDYVTFEEFTTDKLVVMARQTVSPPTMQLSEPEEEIFLDSDLDVITDLAELLQSSQRHYSKQRMTSPPPIPAEALIDSPEKQASAFSRHFNRGFTHYHSQRYNLALEEWQAALDLQPDHKGLQSNIRHLQHRLGSDA